MNFDNNEYTCHLRQITTILNWMCEDVLLNTVIVSYVIKYRAVLKICLPPSFMIHKVLN